MLSNDRFGATSAGQKRAGMSRERLVQLLQNGAVIAVFEGTCRSIEMGSSITCRPAPIMMA